MILHIPHSSCVIPDNFRDQIVLSDKELLAELLLMTDWFTDELFTFPEAKILRFPISRLILDVERFSDDTKEPMSNVGMGMIYNRTAHGNPLKRELKPHEMGNLEQYYTIHHKRLFEEVNKDLENSGHAFIVDCHSFPSIPLQCDMNKSIPRPDFCVGTDSFHTPDSLIRITDKKIKELGYTIGINQPYAGSMVPLAFYHKDCRVTSIMIEVNRMLYMDEMTGIKKDTFESTGKTIQIILSLLKEYQKTLY
jgi:N-formylglutamate amidohydrolase